ncbi:low temperature requirement protein A [Micromonospora musae]|uniref:Low temperature requirement protein A n=1 Tax=Micromonospora musae TaxID=1894970 RepID=A0A3A9XSF1_9ACTN|nr:low temperature requirement protein A [Micromonospora musae]
MVPPGARRVAGAASESPVPPPGSPGYGNHDQVRTVRPDDGSRWRWLTDRLVQSRPAVLGDEAGHRHASWLELFFDVVFVFALAAVAGRLGHDPTPRLTSVLAAAGIFVVVEWAWVGHVYYDTRYDPDDSVHRLMMLGALLGAGAITLGVDEVPKGLLFPVGYLIVRGVLLLLYLRARPTSEGARMVTTVYLIGFGAGWLIWLVSLFVPSHLRPWFWVVGICVDLATPWVGYRRLNRFPVDARHLPERIGQFTIIVLGSSVADLLAAMPRYSDASMVLYAALAFVVPASIWWIYTTFVGTGVGVDRLKAGHAYSYIHTPLLGALLLLGWALGQLVRMVDSGAGRVSIELRLVLAGSLFVWMGCELALRGLLASISGERWAVAAYGVTSVGLVVFLVPSPALLLALLAAAMLGQTVLRTRELNRLSREHAHTGASPGRS